MESTVRIPTPLRTLTGGLEEVRIEGSTIRDVITNLDTRHPGIGARLLDESGAVRRFVNIYVGEEDIRFMDGLDTPVGGQEISIVPAIAGG